MAEKLDLEFHDEQNDINEDGSVDVDVTLRFSLNELREKSQIQTESNNEKIKVLPRSSGLQNNHTDYTKKLEALEKTIEAMKVDIRSLKDSSASKEFKKLEQDVSKILLELSKDFPKAVDKLKRIKLLIKKFGNQD